METHTLSQRTLVEIDHGKAVDADTVELGVSIKVLARGLGFTQEDESLGLTLVATRSPEEPRIDEELAESLKTLVTLHEDECPKGRNCGGVQVAVALLDRIGGK